MLEFNIIYVWQLSYIIVLAITNFFYRKLFFLSDILLLLISDKYNDLLAEKGQKNELRQHNEFKGVLQNA